jgi:uncharacterized protein (DUF736 family)
MRDWKKVGAFWKKTSEAGKHYLGGEVEINGVKTNITCWSNDKGGVEKRPDFVIYLDDRTPDKAEWPTENRGEIGETEER